MDKGEDQLYSHILAGIYLPYMVELQKYMQSNTVSSRSNDLRKFSLVDFINLRMVTFEVVIL